MDYNPELGGHPLFYFIYPFLIWIMEFSYQREWIWILEKTLLLTKKLISSYSYVLFNGEWYTMKEEDLPQYWKDKAYQIWSEESEFPKYEDKINKK